MNERVEAILQRWDEIAQALCQPEVAADPTRTQSLLRERSELEEIVTVAHALQDIQQQLVACESAFDDPELADMAKEEAAQLRASIAEKEAQLASLTRVGDPRDKCNAVIEIRAGVGGEESALFAADLYRMYEHYATRRGFSVEAISASPTELGGMKEIVFIVSGRNVWARFKYESGVHRVQRIPLTESSGRKQTSACTVAVFPEVEETEFRIDPNDLRIDTYRASGAGGQHVNRTDSAVRITHLPTGIVVTSQDQRSQIQNRTQAMKVLRAKLLDRAQAEAESAQAADRRSQVGTGDRSERIRTYNFHESRVTDHRIGLTLYRIQDIMDGDLDEIVDALDQKLQPQQNA